MAEARPIAAPQGYRAFALVSPVEPDVAEGVLELLRHKGEPWVGDIRARLEGNGLDLTMLAFAGDEPVAHCWLGSSRGRPGVGLVGHVFTRPEHRRRGLAGCLVSAAAQRFEAAGGRWLLLHTDNPGAARLYERLGFRTERKGTMGGYAADSGWLMLYGVEADEYFEQSGRWRVEPFERCHYPALVFLLAVLPEPHKLPSLEMNTGMDAEIKLLRAYESQERGESLCRVLLDDETGRPQGFARTVGADVEVYAPRVPPDASAMLRARALEGARGSTWPPGARPPGGPLA